MAPQQGDDRRAVRPSGGPNRAYSAEAAASAAKAGPDREEWFTAAFGEHYLEVYSRRDAKAAGREASFAAERLGLGPGERVLDLCCGPGHHLEALRAMGLAAVGVDLSPELLKHARTRGPVARGDMRRVPYAGPFGAVLSFFTSFGYFGDEDDRLVAAEIARLLSAGGGFLIDYLNPARVRATFVPESEREVRGHRIRETRRIEEGPPRVLKRVEITSPSGECRSYTESVRLYEEGEMRGLLDGEGLEVQETCGDFDGSAFAPDSPRMILIGRKARSVRRRFWRGGSPMFMQIPAGGDRNFAYLFGEGGEAAAVDPIAPERVEEAARESGVKIKYIVNTHGHYDHSAGNDVLKSATGAKLIAHEAARAGEDIAVTGGEKFTLGGTKFEIIATPGHTRDSICVLWEGRLVTGDTLFVGKVGGTDLGEGARLEYESLHGVMAKLPDETEVWPGHDVGVDPSSTMGREKETNPFYLQPDLESFVDLKRNWAEYKRKHGIE